MPMCHIHTNTHVIPHSAEVARLSSEELIRDMKQRTGQQLRELQVDRGEVQRSLSEHQQAAERRERQLTVCVCVRERGYISVQSVCRCRNS